MAKASPLPVSLPQPVFSTAEAITHGVSARRLRASDLRRPFRGIRSTAESETLEQRCREYLPRLRDDQFFSRVTAARLYGIPLPRALETRDELDVTGRQSRPRTTGVIGHRAVATPVAFVRFGGRFRMFVPAPIRPWRHASDC